MAAKRSKKSSKAPKKAARKAPARKAPKATRRPASKAAKKSSRPAARAKGGKGPDTRIRCAATDPFGGPCQNTPRLGSTYCGVHSHLEAM